MDTIIAIANGIANTINKEYKNHPTEGITTTVTEWDPTSNTITIKIHYSSGRQLATLLGKLTVTHKGIEVIYAYYGADTDFNDMFNYEPKRDTIEYADPDFLNHIHNAIDEMIKREDAYLHTTNRLRPTKQK